MILAIKITMLILTMNKMIAVVREKVQQAVVTYQVHAVDTQTLAQCLVAHLETCVIAGPQIVPALKDV